MKRYRVTLIGILPRKEKYGLTVEARSPNEAVAVACARMNVYPGNYAASTLEVKNEKRGNDER